MKRYLHAIEASSFFVSHLLQTSLSLPYHVAIVFANESQEDTFTGHCLLHNSQQVW